MLYGDAFVALMSLLKTLDLFSGVGGITHALKGFADPLAYCDSFPEAQHVLLSLMKRGKLPQAPICPDVSELNMRWIRQNCKSTKVDMIVAGFPCVGFSSLGLYSGFENAQSGLFLHILRLVDETDCRALFLENVPNVLKIGMSQIVKELNEKRGFELRWCVTHSSHVGSRQTRARWFCLAVKKGFRYVHRRAGTRSAHKYDMYPWDKMPEPPRMVLNYDHTLGKRLELLGNSVIPDAVRYSFVYLATCFTFKDKKLDLPEGFVISASCRQHPSNAKQIKKTKRVPEADECQDTSKGRQGRRVPPMSSFPRTGRVTANGEYAPVTPSSSTARAGDPWRKMSWKPLVFDPRVFRSAKPPGALLVKEGILDRPITKKLWATPRRSCTGAGNFLTERLSHDLPTQIRFEIGTNDKIRSGKVSPEFVEYLMGFPIGWTAYSS